MKSIFKRLCVFVISHMPNDHMAYSIQSVSNFQLGQTVGKGEGLGRKITVRVQVGSWKRGSLNQTLSLAEFALICCHSDMGIPASWASPFPKP